MTGDLKTGYLLRAKPKNQFVAQLVGAVVAVFLTTGLFVLFTTAAPCILYPPATGECEFNFMGVLLFLSAHFAHLLGSYGAPSVAAWTAVAFAVSSPRLREFSPYIRSLDREDFYRCFNLPVSNLRVFGIHRHRPHHRRRSHRGR